jgi:hypothetical protein
MRHVHFLVDTESPFTYICDEAIQSFNRTVPNPHNPFSVHVNGNPVLVLQSPEDRHKNAVAPVSSSQDAHRVLHRQGAAINRHGPANCITVL